MSTLPPIDFENPLEAELFVKDLFSDSPQRLRHILVVADRCRQTARDINELNSGINLDETLCYCAGLIHDLGYAESLSSTGFHPKDGAVFLQSRGFERLAALVAGHSSAPEEAVLRKIEGIKAADNLAGKTLTFSDMQTSPSGQPVTYNERLSDILQRYGEHSIEGQANLLARPRIEAIINEINRLMRNIPQ